MDVYRPPFGSSAGYYWKRGINVIPLIPRSKKPSTKFKQHLYNRQSPQTINYLQSYYTHHNIGILTGRVSGIAVIDVDGPEGEASILEYSMPETLKVKTKRGYHLYYKIPGATPCPGMNSLLPGVDFKADGGFVVAPPSLTVDGEPYKWSESPSMLDSIPPLPEWVANKVKMARTGIIPKGMKGVEYHYKRKDWLKEVVEGTHEGRRNETCARYSGLLISKGYDEDTCVKELLIWNLKNVPPMPENELMGTFYSIYNKNTVEAYNNSKEIDLKAAKKKIAEWLQFEDDTIIDVILATAITYKHEAGPVWTIIVGPPSSGKTELLRSLRGFTDTLFVESITARTLFTGKVGCKGILERHNQPYMLLINKDFGSIMSKGSSEKALILQQLRGVFDGDYTDETGSGKEPIEWNNRLNFLSAATQDIESIENQKAIGDLGERFLYFKMKPESDESVRKKALNAISGLRDDKSMRKAVSEAMIGVLKKYIDKDEKEIGFPQSVAEWLVELCMVAVKLRTRVKREAGNRNKLEFKPNPEGVMRMLKSVKSLMIGIAMIRGHKDVEVQDYAVAARVVMDSVPGYRRNLLKIMYFNNRWLRLKDVSKMMRIPDVSASGLLDDLVITSVLDKESQQVEFGPSMSRMHVYRIKPALAKSVLQSGLEGLL